MAALLQTDAEGLNRAAADYHELYPIAARCGVFAKSDIQPLINEGATLPDLAASIFQAVVNQTISGLGLRQAHPRLRRLPRRPAALPAGAQKGLHPHAAPDAGEYRRSRQLPSVCCHGAALEAGDAEPGRCRSACRKTALRRADGLRAQASAAAVCGPRRVRCLPRASQPRTDP